MKRKKNSSIRTRVSYNKIYLPCKICKTEQEVYDDVKEVICHICVCKMTGPPPEVKSNVIVKSIHPRGWKFMKEYVDINGNVYHRGVLQPNLKNKKPITDVEELKRKQKLNLEQKKEKKRKRMIKKGQKLLEQRKKNKKRG